MDDNSNGNVAFRAPARLFRCFVAQCEVGSGVKSKNRFKKSNPSN